MERKLSICMYLALILLAVAGSAFIIARFVESVQMSQYYEQQIELMEYSSKQD